MELVVVGSPTCAPCKILTKVLKEEEIPFTYVDATKNEEFVKRHNIELTPTTLLFEERVTDDYALSMVVGYDDIKEDQIFELVDLL